MAETEPTSEATPDVNETEEPVSEQTAPTGAPPAAKRPELAMPFARLAARVIDAIVVGFGILLVSLPFLSDLTRDGFDRWSPNQIAGYLATIVIISLGYETFMVATVGATIGKRALGLRVVDRAAWAMTGAVQPLTWSQAALRALPSSIGLFPIARIIGQVCFAISSASVLLNDERRSVYDYAAGSVVISDR